ncbi:MAG: hypothetical protein ACON5F_15925 [Jejuia sp.]
MKFSETAYFKTSTYQTQDLGFGVLYLFDAFFISEINSGTHLDQGKVESLMDTLNNFYGKDAEICFISNRVNSYSSNPQLWVKALEHFDIFYAGAIVFYNLTNLMNFEIESRMCPKQVKGFSSLEEAIEWTKAIKATS